MAFPEPKGIRTVNHTNVARLIENAIMAVAQGRSSAEAEVNRIVRHLRENMPTMTPQLQQGENVVMTATVGAATAGSEGRVVGLIPSPGGYTYRLEIEGVGAIIAQYDEVRRKGDGVFGESKRPVSIKRLREADEEDTEDEKEETVSESEESDDDDKEDKPDFLKKKKDKEETVSESEESDEKDDSEKEEKDEDDDKEDKPKKKDKDDDEDEVMESRQSHKVTRKSFFEQAVASVDKMLKG